FLRTQAFTPPARRMISTVTADEVTAGTDVPELLTRQVREPVRFAEAVQTLSAEVDLLLEVGPGKILRGLVEDIAPGVPVVSLDADSTSLSGLLTAAAAAYALGARLESAALFEGRFTRPLPLDKEFRFFASPAESTPDVDLRFADVHLDALTSPAQPEETTTGAAAGGGDSLSVVLRLAAERAELPLEAVNPHSNPLDELHLSSITVAQIMNRAAQELGITAPMVTTAFATSTLAELAGLLDALQETGNDDGAERPPAAQGVAPWVRAFAIDLVPTEPGPVTAPASAGDGDWELFASERHPLAPALHEALSTAGLGGGVLLCLPEDCDENHTAL
ncbi:phosphopantetheine-binding protein, partial [Streptomyces rubiginosohelvolus]